MTHMCQGFNPPLKSQVTNSVNFYSASQKILPPCGFWIFFSNGLEFLIKILHDYYTFTVKLNYKILFSYLQLWQSYAVLCTNTLWKTGGGKIFWLTVYIQHWQCDRKGIQPSTRFVKDRDIAQGALPKRALDKNIVIKNKFNLKIYKKLYKTTNFAFMAHHT